MPGDWVRRSPAGVDARVRLFCFAHAGGGSAFFRPWRAVLEPEIEICPVVLPGRESRVREPPFTSTNALVGPLTGGLLPHLDRPFAFFGHSVGAVVAYEATRALARAAKPLPSVLVVSGRRAPHLPARRPPLHGLPDDRFLAAVGALNGTPSEVLEHRRLLEVFLPVLRSDFEINETYVPSPGGRLACPISSYMGRVDPEVTPDEMRAWEQVTEDRFELRVFEGDHFYLKGTPFELMAAIRARLASPLPASDW